MLSSVIPEEVQSQNSELNGKAPAYRTSDYPTPALATRFRAPSSCISHVEPEVLCDYLLSFLSLWSLSNLLTVHPWSMTDPVFVRGDFLSPAEASRAAELGALLK